MSEGVPVLVVAIVYRQQETLACRFCTNFDIDPPMQYNTYVEADLAAFLYGLIEILACPTDASPTGEILLHKPLPTIADGQNNQHIPITFSQQNFLSNILLQS